MTQHTCSAEALKPEEILQLSRQIPGWEIGEKRLQREFRFKDFSQAMDFANKLAVIADEQNHHPDLHVSYGRVKVELSTHEVGGLSRCDFMMAERISSIQGAA